MAKKKRLAIMVSVLALVAGILILLFLLPLKITEKLPWKAHRIPLRAKGANIILFTIDTLRADHLQCYGYQKVETPQINRLAEEGVLFENVVCQTPLTLPSHSSIFTGTYPLFHGVRDNGGFYLDEKHTTLAECLKKEGFLTGAFVAAFVLDSRWGLDQGFDYYYDNFDLTKYKTVSLDSVQRRGDEVLQEARRWLSENGQKKFFAWIHLYDPHTPYDPPEPYKSLYRARPYSLYNGEIAYVDQLIGEFRSFLQEKGLLQNTLIVFTADHGESLGEHKESAHGFFVYDAAIRVPLILRFPGAKGPKGEVIRPQVRSIDLMPTILDLVGEDVPSAVQGKSLVPLIRGKGKGDQAAYSETFFPKFHYGWSELRTLRRGRYKFIDAPNPEVYDLLDDPGETQNIVNIKASLGQEMKRELVALLERYSAKSVEEAGPRAVDQDSLVKLQALGYIGSFHGSREPKDGERPADPKDKIELYNEIKQAQFLSSEDKPREAEEKILSVLARDPLILEARYLLGHLYYKQKKYEEAIAEFKKALEKNPDYSDAIFGLALAYKETRRFDEAIVGFRRLMEIDPKDTKPNFHLSDIYQDRGDLDEAVRLVQAALQLDPEVRLLYNRLGALYLEKKMYEAAEKEIRHALTMERSAPLFNAHFNLALIHEARGELDLALSEYRKEQETSPFNYKPDYNLGLLYLREKDYEAAIKELNGSIKKQEDYAPAYIFLAKCFMDSGKDFLEAEKLALKGLSLKPDYKSSILGHFLLADIYNRLGDTRESQHHLRLARELQQANR